MTRPLPKWLVLICSSLLLGLLSACRPVNNQSAETLATVLPTSSRQQNTPTFIPPDMSNSLISLDIGDGGFLSRIPCGPPCFWNITPGITTKQQTINIFQEHFDQHFDISNCRLWNDQGIVCNPIGIEFNTLNKVDYISYSPTQPITVEDAIAKYGQPNAVDIEGGGASGGVTKFVWMVLFFDDIRTAIGLPDQDGMNYNVEPTTQIDKINYPGISKWEKGTTVPLQPWVGFGKYKGPTWAGP